MATHPPPDYTYRGARALVLLHERYMREFLLAWKRAHAARVRLPATDDPDYASHAALLHHGLRAARGSMTWLCEKLGLPDPGIEPAPGVDTVEKDADRYVEHLLARWRLPLARVAGAGEDRDSAQERGACCRGCSRTAALSGPTRLR